MANPDLKSIDEYEVFLTEKITQWSAERRVALAAAITEHWLPAYESFSAEENWGDPASMHPMYQVDFARKTPSGYEWSKR